MREKQTLLFLKTTLVIELLIVVLSVIAIRMSGTNLAVLALLNAVISSVSIFMIAYTMRFAMKGDLHQYPYGMGRLENAAEFSFHLLLSVGVGLALINIVREILHPPHHETMELGWVEALYFLSALGSIGMFFMSRRLLRVENSSMLHSLNHTYLVRSWHKLGAALLIPVLARLLHHMEHAHLWIDLGLSLTIGVYEFSIHLPKVGQNFRALVDFPLQEEEQMKIMAFLARHFHDYEHLGRIYTTRKGSGQVVEVELAFPDDTDVNRLLQIEQSMCETFKQEFPQGEFRIRPFAARF